MSLLSVRRLTSVFFVTLTLVATPTAALAQSTITESATAVGEAVDQGAKENIIYAAIYWLAEKTAPAMYNSTSSNSSSVVLAVLDFGRDIGYEGSAWYGDGSSSVRASVVDVNYVSVSNYDMEFLVEFIDGDEHFSVVVDAHAKNGSVTLGSDGDSAVQIR